MTAAANKKVRCAIYTRVSTEAGLDQDFNSLDAQNDAAQAYIRSQAHAGWTLIRHRYDDGGFSGGSTDRPALQQLIADIKAPWRRGARSLLRQWHHPDGSREDWPQVARLRSIQTTSTSRCGAGRSTPASLPSFSAQAKPSRRSKSSASPSLPPPDYGEPTCWKRTTTAAPIMSLLRHPGRPSKNTKLVPAVRQGNISSNRGRAAIRRAPNASPSQWQRTSRWRLSVRSTRPSSSSRVKRSAS